MSKKTVKTNFSRYAEHYDDHSAVQSQCARVLVENMRETAFTNILEIGCGTGAYTELLADKYPGARITAVDISDSMVDVARQKLSCRNVRVLAADAEQIAFDEKFDLITSNAAFQWFERLEDTFAGIKGMLARNGEFHFAMYGPKTFSELEDVLRLHLGKRPWLSSCNFMDDAFLTDILKRNFRKFAFEEKHFIQDFGSLWDFISDIKRSGSRGNGLGENIFLGKMMIYKLEQAYIEKFGGIKATHHVFFGRAKR